jgi:hypothetical protein
MSPPDVVWRKQGSFPLPPWDGVMSKTVLFAAASVLALTAGGASAVSMGSLSGSPFQTSERATILWDQNSNYADDAIDSQNFGYPPSNDQGADDFVVPEGTTWTVTEVDVSGQYFNGLGPATSENVIFYRNDKFGRPGKVLKTLKKLKGGGLGTSGANFAIALPNGGITLTAGHYWVSVIANLDFNKGGEWGWDLSSVLHGDQAMWRNPGGGCCCVTWDTIENCIGVPGPGFMFDLRGTSERKWR